MIMMMPPQSDKSGVKKGTWSREEDGKLIAYIRRHGIWNWNEMPRAAGLSRTGKSCRLRWMNYLRPNLKHGNFSKDEAETILKMYEMLGSRWAAMAKRLPGRTDNEIKNYFNTYLRKKYFKDKAVVQATDPQLHPNPKVEPEEKFSPLKVEPEEKNLSTEQWSSDSSKSKQIPMSPVMFGDNSSWRFNLFNNKIDQNQAMDENNCAFESCGEQAFSMEEAMYADHFLFGEKHSNNKEGILSGNNPLHSCARAVSNRIEGSIADPMSLHVSTENAFLSSEGLNINSKILNTAENVGFLESHGDQRLQDRWAQPFSTDEHHLYGELIHTNQMRSTYPISGSYNEDENYDFEVNLWSTQTNSNWI